MRLRLSLALLLPLFATPAHAQWEWLYPTPQGHTLNDVVFLDNSTAIAVGEFGTVLVTHDDGTSWMSRSNVAGVETDLLRIDRVDANSAVAVGRGGVIIRTDDQGATWTTPASGTTLDLVDVSFIDANHGIAIRLNAALRTIDGGVTWTAALVPGPPLRAVDMISADDAIAVGDFGMVTRTADGGATWESDAQPLDGNFASIDFGDALNGIVGSPHLSYVTSDGGATWSPFYFDPNGQWENHFVYTPNEITFVSSSLSFSATGVVSIAPDSHPFETPRGQLDRSTNGGTSWSPLGFAMRNSNGLARSSDGTIIMVGDGGQILRCDNAGNFSQVGGTPEDYQWGDGSHSFLTPETGIVMCGDDWYFRSGGSSFARTHDGGQTWAVSRFSSATCRDLIHLTAADVYAVGLHENGARASVLRSSDGGATWSQVWSDVSVADLVSIARGSNTRAVAVGPNGDAVVIDNGTVTPVVTGTGVYLSDVSFATASTVVAVGDNGVIVRSTDAGLSWNPVTSGVTGLLRGVDFVSSLVGFILGSDILLRTEDGGATWQPVLSTVMPSARAFDFFDSLHGVAAGENGLAIATNDGGLSWHDLEGLTAHALAHATMFSPQRVYFSGYDQILFEYRLTTTPTLVTSFDGFASGLAVDLRWTLHDEANLSHFEIMRFDAESTYPRTIASFVPPQERAYRDGTATPGQTHAYLLVAHDNDGSAFTSQRIEVTLPVASFALLPNQPNPFNPSTTVHFTVPERTRVSLSIYDVSGRRVVTLLDEPREAGLQSAEWNGLDARGQRVASGVYVARLQAGKQTATRKMVLLK